MTVINAYWNCVQDDLKLKISLSQYQAWLSRVNFVKTTNLGKNAILEVPSKFNKERIEKKYRQDLLASMNKYYPKVCQIDFIIKEPTEAQQLDQDQFVEALIASTDPELNSKDLYHSPNSYASRTPSKSKKHDSGVVSQDLIVSTTEAENSPLISYSVLPKQNIHNLNSKFTFDNLVSTTYNELAVSVAHAVIKKPGQLYNPVFIHSSTGLGKTHLLQAIGHKVLEIYPNYNIRYTTSETFLNHYTACMQKGRGNEFHEYYRSVDILLIDDIQFITNKVSTQEVLFHTFNELHQQNKQIIFTSDRSPKQLSGFQDRLISRFEWGMVLDLGQPTTEDRIAIINHKLQTLNLTLSDRQIHLIAENVQTNIRDLEGVLNQIQARVEFQPNLQIDEVFLTKILAPYIGIINQGSMQFTYNPTALIEHNQTLGNLPVLAGNKPSKLSKLAKVELRGSKHTDYNKIFELIAIKLHVSKEEIMSKRRDKNTSLARQIIMYSLIKKYGLSTTKVGKLIGGRTHPTVLHAIKSIQSKSLKSKQFQDMVSMILVQG